MLVLKLLHQSDYQRWTTPGSLETWWDTRTEKIAQLIPPNTRVLEFGAGRRQLEKLLDRSCSYIPSDLTDRGPGTIICDLNQPLPDLRYVQADVAVFSGVLEYVRDLEALVKWLAAQVSFCVASYTYIAPNQNVLQRMRDRVDRLYYGYMHNYTEEELVHLFNQWGFVCTAKDTWTSQRIFLFANQRPGSLFHGHPKTFSLSPATSKDCKA